MSSEYGTSWRINVGTAVNPETFIPIGGEVSFDWSRQSKEIDLGSKDDGAYQAKGYGSQSVTISVNGKLKLPDPGLQRVDTVAKTVPPVVDVQIMKGGVVKFAGVMAVGNFSTTFPNDDAATYKFDLVATQAPTVDALGATA